MYGIVSYREWVSVAASIFEKYYHCVYTPSLLLATAGEISKLVSIALSVILQLSEYIILIPSAGSQVGVHVFEVRAVDSADNVDPNPAVFEWTINIRGFQ